MTERIPFVDLKGQHRKLHAEMSATIEAVLESCAFIQGPFVATFEREFTEQIGVQHGIGCSNGTSAISLVLEALGVGRGDEVITVAHTFFATVEAVFHVGAVPVFVDVDPRSYTLDAERLEAAITPKTKAIIAVHLYGTPCDMAPIQEIAKKYGLFVIEDAAQAHLATYGGIFAGAIGDAATFSFYPGKNLGAIGDAGLITTNSDALAERLRRLRDHGRLSKYEHDVIGYNQRMDGLQAAVLSVKLRHLPRWTELRRRNAALYNKLLRPCGFKTIEQSNKTGACYHLYVVEVSNRDELMKRLTEAGIGCGVHYPVPLHLQPALEGRAPGRGSLPVTEKVAQRVISLPMCAELSEQSIEQVCEVFLKHAKP